MAVTRLIIFCEGQTEEIFCNLVLEPHFRELGVVDVRPLLLPNKAGATARLHKGGWNSYVTARHFLRKVMLEQRGAGVWFTSLFDLYRLPNDFPAPAGAALLPARSRVEALEKAMERDLSDAASGQFIGRLQLHEFEALLYSDLDVVQRAFPDNLNAITALRTDIGALTPEEINERPETAPSKRLIKYIPQYKGLKTSEGPRIAENIGLAGIRSKCPHFDAWISRIEAKCAE